MELKNRIWEIRKKRKINRRTLAKLLNVHSNTVQNWDKNISQPRHEYHAALCQLLDARDYELFYYISLHENIENPLV